MPILKTIFLYVIPGFMATTYAVFRLENKLPIASRRIGQRIGLGYQIFKSILKINLPTDTVKSNQLVKLLRQTDQQANAFNRELRSQIYKIKQEIKEQVPNEMKENPFLKLQLQTKIEEQQQRSLDQKLSVKISNGSDNILSLLTNRECLIKIKEAKETDKQFKQNL